MPAGLFCWLLTALQEPGFWRGFCLSGSRGRAPRHSCGWTGPAAPLVSALPQPTQAGGPLGAGPACGCWQRPAGPVLAAGGCFVAERVVFGGAQQDRRSPIRASKSSSSSDGHQAPARARTAFSVAGRAGGAFVERQAAGLGSRGAVDFARRAEPCASLPRRRCRRRSRHCSRRELPPP